MRLWHLIFGIVIVAVALAIARDPAGRVALIVFVVALGEVVLATSSLLGLFRTLGAFGEARGLLEHAEALVATTVVLAAGTLMMWSLFFVGAWLVRAATV